jgi:hypothetical protein
MSEISHDLSNKMTVREPYKLGLIEKSPYIAKKEIKGEIVAILDLIIKERGMKLIDPISRVLTKNSVCEIAVTNEKDAGPGKVVNYVGYLGFMMIEDGGVAVVGDKVFIGDNMIGVIAGFDETHAPNHITLLLKADEVTTGNKLGLKVGMKMRITSPHGVQMNNPLDCQNQTVGASKKICVDPEFVDLTIYAIYYAIYDLLKEDTWKIVWKAGEVLYNEIKEKIKTVEVKEPFEALRRLAKWLKDVGYIEDIEVHKVAEDEVEYVMLNPIISPGAKRLIDQGRVPAHISTALMFAVLKQFNMKAEMVGTPKFLPDGRVVERWKLIKK